MASKDYAHVETDKELAELESRIAQVYADAAAEMKITVDDYFDSYAKRYEQYLNEYNAGNITKEEFQQWELNQIGRGERYEAMQNALANRFVNADEVAMAYVNDATPSIYSLNRNYSNYSIDQYAKGSSKLEPDFALWDESTVRNLIVNQPDLMPNYPKSRAIQRGIDLAYGKSQITKAVTSGILQGKSLSKIARDLMNRIEGMSLNSALRAARTATTAAENAGRQDSYEEAADMGLKMEKVWLATLDSRTRVAHQQADMQVVGYDKTFNVGGESLMFPGDASHGASGWNLYNCRCTMFEKPEGMSMDDFERWARDPLTGLPEQVTGESYEDWLKDKQEEAQAQAATQSTNDLQESDENNRIDVIDYSDFIRFDSGKQADDYFLANGEPEWENGLTTSEYNSLRDYTGYGYTRMNDYLRNGIVSYGASEDEIKDQINNVSRAISKFKLNDDIVVYRGCSDPELAKDHTGTPYIDKGLMSTSTNRKIAQENFNGDYLLEILIPKGEGIGAWVSDISSVGKFENEFLMQRSSTEIETGQPRETVQNKWGDDITLIHMAYTGNNYKGDLK